MIILSFVGRALTEQRRQENTIAAEQAKRLAGVEFSQTRIVGEKLGRGGKADTLQSLGVHVLLDDQSAIVREAQKTGCAAFRNYPHFGPSGFNVALENVREYIESRNQIGKYYLEAYATDARAPLDMSGAVYEEIEQDNENILRSSTGWDVVAVPLRDNQWSALGVSTATPKSFTGSSLGACYVFGPPVEEGNTDKGCVVEGSARQVLAPRETWLSDDTWAWVTRKRQVRSWRNELDDFWENLCEEELKRAHKHVGCRADKARLVESVVSGFARQGVEKKTKELYAGLRNPKVIACLAGGGEDRA